MKRSFVRRTPIYREERLDKDRQFCFVPKPTKEEQQRPRSRVLFDENLRKAVKLTIVNRYTLLDTVTTKHKPCTQRIAPMCKLSWLERLLKM